MLLINAQEYFRWIDFNKSITPTQQAWVPMCFSENWPSASLDLISARNWLDMDLQVPGTQLCPWSRPTCPHRKGGSSWLLGIIECDTSCTQVDTDRQKGVEGGSSGPPVICL